MLVTESINSINRQLADLFGRDTITGKPIWRVVWSEDQFEKRLMHQTDSGLQLLTPEIREVPKYRQWIQNRHILERLTVVPMGHLEMNTEQISYEPIWTFEGLKGIEVPPTLQAAKFIIDTLYAASGKSSLAKYTDPSLEEGANEARLEKIEEELFGNETDVGDALAHKQAIVVPGRIN